MSSARGSGTCFRRAGLSRMNLSSGCYGSLCVPIAFPGPRLSPRSALLRPIHTKGSSQLRHRSTAESSRGSCRSGCPALLPACCDRIKIGGLRSSTARGASLGATTGSSIRPRGTGFVPCIVARCTNAVGTAGSRSFSGSTRSYSMRRFDARPVVAISLRRHPFALRIAGGSGTGSGRPSRARCLPEPSKARQAVATLLRGARRSGPSGNFASRRARSSIHTG